MYVECDSCIYRYVIDRYVVSIGVVMRDGRCCGERVALAGAEVCDGMQWRVVATMLRELVTVRE